MARLAIFLVGIPYCVVAIPYTSWLSGFQKTLLVNLPILPGSHDSHAVSVSDSADWQAQTGWDYFQTQTLSIREQLDLGIRFLDLRLHVYLDVIDIEDSVVLSHTYDTNLTLSEALSDVKDFLTANPTEFVILYLRIDFEHPLKGDVTSKQEFVRDTIIDSGVSIAAYSNSDIKTLLVSSLAGKVLILGPNGVVLPPSSSAFTYVDSSTGYSVCAIWEESTVSKAQGVLAGCFPTVPVSGTVSGMITGYAIDGSLNNVPPVDTSLVMNDWFFGQFDNNSKWVARTKYPVGVVLINFVSEAYMSEMVGHALGISEVEVNTSDSDIDVKAGSHMLFQTTLLGVIALVVLC